MDSVGFVSCLQTTSHIATCVQEAPQTGLMCFFFFPFWSIEVATTQELKKIKKKKSLEL